MKADQAAKAAQDANDAAMKAAEAVKAAEEKGEGCRRKGKRGRGEGRQDKSGRHVHGVDEEVDLSVMLAGSIVSGSPIWPRPAACWRMREMVRVMLRSARQT